MAFETFDLGRVLQTAEAIKAQRRQPAEDELRNKVLNAQLAATEQGTMLQKQAADQQLAATEQGTMLQKQAADQQMEATTAHRAYYTSRAILSAADPKAAAESLAPDFVKQFDATHGQGAWKSLTPEQTVQAAKAIQTQALGIIGPQQKVKWVDSGGQQVAVDDETGEPIQNIKPIVKTAAPTSNVVTGVGRDGKPVFMNEANAAGRPAYVKPEKGLRIQSDGAGGFSLYEGEGAAGINLGTAPTNALQTSAIGAQGGLDRISNIRAGFDPKWLTYKSQFSQAKSNLQDKAQGIPGVPELSAVDRAELGRFQNFKSNVLDNTNQTIKDLTGASMGVQEAERIKGSIPNIDDGPVAFQSKMDAVEQRLKTVLARSIYTQKQGIKFDAIPLEQMSSLMTKRGDEIYRQEFARSGDANAAREATVNALKSEFYKP